MRARHHEGRGRGNEVRIEIIFTDCHVGTIGAEEYQGEGVLVADAENDEGRQAFRIGLDMADIDSLAL